MQAPTTNPQSPAIHPHLVKNVEGFHVFAPETRGLTSVDVVCDQLQGVEKQ